MTLIKTDHWVNKNSQITDDLWGITLVCDKGTRHARIVFEGVENNASFRKVADFVGGQSVLCGNHQQGCYSGKDKVGSIRIQDKSHNEVQYFIKFKTETWILSKDKVKKLIEKIQHENGTFYPFNILGDNSIFATKAETITIHHPILEAINKYDQKLFIGLYDSMKNNGLHTGMSEGDFDNAIADAMQHILDVEIDKKTEVKKFKYIKNEDADRFCRYKNSFNKVCYANLIMLMEKYTGDPEFEVQHNCCTWAKKQLASVGIKLPRHIFDRFITNTRYYTLHEKEKVIPEQISFNHDVSDEFYQDEENTRTLRGRNISYQPNRDKRPEQLKKIDKDWKNGLALYYGADASSVIVSWGSIALVCAGTISWPVLGVACLVSQLAIPIRRYGKEKMDDANNKKSDVLQISQSGGRAIPAPFSISDLYQNRVIRGLNE